MQQILQILIVEDDILLSDMLKSLLSQNGYRVNTAYSGSEALLILEKETFDLILLDLMLPGISGEEVLTTIRKKQTTPIIGVSAKTDIDSRIDLIKNGADDYITKPFDNKELLVRMEAILRRCHRSSNNSLLKFKDLMLNPATMEVNKRYSPCSHKI